ncbi:hypothetical protein CC1G_03246 [Coprinopsis cinerea okayama7|uniref:Uncharacterized protein n=1 Tax=Coprinopsis cinerea (strain Okayama-7 / 130 / ATCC MYA-4618 / FGSC 9003) TaxID=240176 RepID=A8N7A3_COPC7|nr:hypothetical protein CC1G_03246 [Coprinopsis cinerea okayama7\|eukprot:XP_001830709.2 hypothetical protein CC1G_03246 [Coprinopsis cinerea okayama7\
MKPEFDEFGVSEDVLAELQHKWESKVIASHVADFEPPQQQAAAAQPAPHPPPIQYPPHPMHMMQTHPHYANPYAHMAVAAQAQPTVKTEPNDSARYMLNPYAALPPLPGPNVGAARPPTLPPHPGGQTAVYTLTRPLQTQPNASTAASVARPVYTPPQPASQMQPVAATAANGQQQQQQSAPVQHRIPQVDGPSESSDDDDSPSPPHPAFAPRTNHPSLPQPAAAPARPKSPVDSEAINSDLDDSDTDNDDDGDEGGAGESDIVFCTYDKVARVKTKWKCVLKEGMIHVNGKDYLFSKCTGEFEW